jgi:sigma-B regulation protein RsbU (phosphoserine phosphatase)
MNQRRLYKTIESFASQDFKSDTQLLKHVVNEIVKSENISIKGGRIWQYEPSTESYRLIHQIGDIERIEQSYRLPVATYPMFVQLGVQRSIVAKETDKYLRTKGILKYSATGVGEKLPSKKGPVHQYVLALNAEVIDDSLLPELNIISLAVTSSMRGKRIERKAMLLERDLDKAREIQQSILPKSFLQFKNYEIFGVSKPDRIVGGDFFDYLFADDEEDRLSLFLGDAASKGFRAAAQALYVVGALRMGVRYHSKITMLMRRINELVNSTFSEEQFVSLFYAELGDDTRGLMLYANAGHNSPILYHASEQRVEILAATGQILGPFLDNRPRVENTSIAPGDVLCIFSDGISEAMEVAEEMYGEGRLVDMIAALHTRSAEEIVNAILEDVERFSRGSDDSDDKTIVVVKRVR